jgi:uncharacterized protein
MLLDQPISSQDECDPLTAIQNSPAVQINQPAAHKTGCRECDWRFACAGGCPLVTKQAGGQFDERSPYCSIYRALFPRLLRLEGLRILKESSGIPKREVGDSF